jgi:hypothetical protein
VIVGLIGHVRRQWFVVAGQLFIVSRLRDRASYHLSGASRYTSRLKRRLDDRTPYN